MFTDKAIKKYINYTKRILSHARYKVGNNYTEVPIDSITQLDDKTLELRIVINNNNTNNITVSVVEIIDIDNDVLIIFNENLKVKQTNEGALYVIEIDLKNLGGNS